jgi:hypothetical protein
MNVHMCIQVSVQSKTLIVRVLSAVYALLRQALLFITSESAMSQLSRQQILNTALSVVRSRALTVITALLENAKTGMSRPV